MSYASGNNTDTLTFSYKIQKGDYTSDLNYVNESSLILNGGSINSSAENKPAILTLPVGSSSLGGLRNIRVYGRDKNSNMLLARDRGPLGPPILKFEIKNSNIKIIYLLTINIFKTNFIAESLNEKIEGYLILEVANLKAEDPVPPFLESRIVFHVENDWIEKNKVDKRHIKMLKFDNTKGWVELTTKPMAKNDTGIHFMVKTYNFSKVAIGVKTEFSQKVEEPEKQTIVQEPEKQQTPPPPQQPTTQEPSSPSITRRLPTTQEPPQQPITQEPEKEDLNSSAEKSQEDEVRNILFIIIGVIAITILTLATVSIIIYVESFKDRKKSTKKDLFRDKIALIKNFLSRKKPTKKSRYAYDHKKSNMDEDVADVFDQVMLAYSKGTPPSQVTPANNNPSNLFDFRSKILWLHNNHFFPPELKIDFDEEEMADSLIEPKNVDAEPEGPFKGG